MDWCFGSNRRKADVDALYAVQASPKPGVEGRPLLRTPRSPAVIDVSADANTRRQPSRNAKRPPNGGMRTMKDRRKQREPSILAVQAKLGFANVLTPPPAAEAMSEELQTHQRPSA